MTDEQNTELPVGGKIDISAIEQKRAVLQADIQKKKGTEKKLRLGVAGLGRGFMLMLPTFNGHSRSQVVAAASPGADARAQFARDFGGPAYATVDELCRDPDVASAHHSDFGESAMAVNPLN